ncbi:GtrA family protein, partial [Streptomyces sp. SID8455]|nr:GtrA family protein [Streptomyces sp. SID8455]
AERFLEQRRPTETVEPDPVRN